MSAERKITVEIEGRVMDGREFGAYAAKALNEYGELQHQQRRRRRAQLVSFACQVVLVAWWPFAIPGRGGIVLCLLSALMASAKAMQLAAGR